MSRMDKVLALKLFLIAVIGLSSVRATAQLCSTAGSANTSYGYYDWQVDECANSQTLTFTSETGFTTAPGLVQITVAIPRTTTIHEVHGNFAYAVWETSCIGAIVAEVRDTETLNVIAAANPLQFGVSTIDIPIKGTFPNGLPITSLQIQFDQGQCGVFTFSWFLVMS
jgi:hypothetical protein